MVFIMKPNFCLHNGLFRLLFQSYCPILDLPAKSKWVGISDISSKFDMTISAVFVMLCEDKENFHDN